MLKTAVVLLVSDSSDDDDLNQPSPNSDKCGPYTCPVYKLDHHKRVSILHTLCPVYKVLQLGLITTKAWVLFAASTGWVNLTITKKYIVQITDNLKSNFFNGRCVFL